MGVELVYGAWLLLAAALGLSGDDNVVVLLPEPDGKQTEIVITTEGGSQTVSDPYAGVVVTDAKTAPSAPKAFSPTAIERSFADVLAAKPPAPASYQFYFQTGSNEISADQQGLLQDLLADVKRRANPSVIVIGHTDTVGAEGVNYRLALQRADAVRTFLVGEGVAADIITHSSHGERDPIVPTADNTPEPKNRRVEVMVR